MVEFALIGPIVLLMLFFIIDFGRGIYYFVTIDNAANEGARTAVRSSAQPGTSATLPQDQDVVNSIQQHTAAVFLSQDCPNGPIDTSAAGAPPPNVGWIYITEVPAPTAKVAQASQHPNAPGGQPLVNATSKCDAIVPVGTPLPGSSIDTTNVALQVTIRYNFVPVTPVIQGLANTINVPLVLQAYAIYRTEY
ncbi:MAG TPA: TadE family protein [Candidatus Dormibacteraeota bacterium]